MRKALNHDDYIANFPAEVQLLLHQMRHAIAQAIPKAEEVISYGMPAFRQGGVLVYYAAFKSHIGFFPTSSGIANFQKELLLYKSSKGGVQFPFDKKLPLALIKKIALFRLKEVQAKAAHSKSKR